MGASLELITAAQILAELARVRAELDEVDAELVRLVARRSALGLQAGRLKRSAGLPVRDHAREARAIAQARAWAADSGLSESQVDELFRLMISHSRAAQLAEPNK